MKLINFRSNYVLEAGRGSFSNLMKSSKFIDELLNYQCKPEFTENYFELKEHINQVYEIIEYILY